MGAKNSESQQATFWKLNSKADGKVSPAFYKVEKVNGKWATTQSFDTLYGRVVAIETGSFEWNGEVSYKVKIALKDEKGQLDIVDCMFNSVTYSILNTLSASDLSKVISMQLYDKVDKNNPAKYWGQVSIKVGEEKGTWKYKPEEIPKAIEGKVGTKVVKDHTPVIEFWIGVVENEIKPAIAAQSINNVADIPDTGIMDESSEGSSDLPF